MPINLRKAAVVAKPHAREAGPVVQALIDWLQQRHIQPIVEEQIASDLADTITRFPLVKPPRDVDLMIVLGGDGTLLSAARAMGARQVPILGVNLGSLGFLTDVALGELYPTLESILTGEHALESRTMLVAEVVRRGKVVSRDTVLNDVVINMGAIARIIEVSVEIDGQSVAVIRADGIIVSTPTGSTAYSLAAGGPILYPGVSSLILTPICPHTLTHRPVVVSDRSRIELTLRSGSGEIYVTLDGQESEALSQGDIVRMRKSRSSVKLVSLPGKNYFRVLRHKLRWSERPRGRRQSKT